MLEKGLFMSEMTPREIVHELDRHIIGQQDAKYLLHFEIAGVVCSLNLSCAKKLRQKIF